MLNKLLFRLTGHLPCRLIDREGVPYLERYYVGKIAGVTFYLHRFVSADEELYLHNHPWRRAYSVVLAKGYDEDVVVDLTPAAGPSGCIMERRPVRWFNRIDGNRFHRITNAQPGTWTLFFHGARQLIRCGDVSMEKGWGMLERVNNTVVYKPWPSPGSDWYLHAPTGNNTRRQPL